MTWDSSGQVSNATGLARAPRPMAPITLGPPMAWYHPRRVLPVVVVLAAVAVVAGGLVLATRDHDPGRWDPRVASLVSFVERERGLTFSHAVPVEFLSVAAFKKKVGASKPLSAADRKELETDTGELRALGLVSGALDLRALGRQLVQEDVIGLYKPAAKRIYVRGTDFTPYVRVTLVHELTHALQDQHVDLAKLNRTRGASSSTVRALVEGDAVQVQRAYIKSLSADDQKAYEAASKASQASADLSGIPQVLVDGFTFPYEFGPTFVSALKASGGTKAIDDALHHPPVAEEQVVNPDRYLSHMKVASVAAPTVPPGDKADGRPDQFGVVGMLEVLGARIGYAPAWKALQGWRGDREVLYRDHGRVCVAVTTAVAGPSSADALAEATTAWTKAVPGASTSRHGEEVELRSCDPGAAAAALPTVDPAPFKVLEARAGILEALLHGGSMAASQAACGADVIVDAIGAAKLVALNDGDGTMDPKAVRAAIVRAGASCRPAPSLTGG